MRIETYNTRIVRIGFTDSRSAFFDSHIYLDNFNIRLKMTQIIISDTTKKINSE